MHPYGEEVFPVEWVSTFIVIALARLSARNNGKDAEITASPSGHPFAVGSSDHREAWLFSLA